MIPKEMYQAVAFETIAVASTAIGFTAAQINPTDGSHIIAALVTAETAEMRWKIVGTTVAATTGHLLYVGDAIEVWHPDLAGFRAIRTGDTSGKLQVTYLRG